MGTQTEQHGEEQAWRDWRSPAELWERIKPLLPLGEPPHPLDCRNPATGRPWTPSSSACRWNVLDETGSVRPSWRASASRSGPKTAWPGVIQDNGLQRAFRIYSARETLGPPSMSASASASPKVSRIMICVPCCINRRNSSISALVSAMQPWVQLK